MLISQIVVLKKPSKSRTHQPTTTTPPRHYDIDPADEFEKITEDGFSVWTPTPRQPGAPNTGGVELRFLTPADEAYEMHEHRLKLVVPDWLLALKGNDQGGETKAWTETVPPDLPAPFKGLFQFATRGRMCCPSSGGAMEKL